MDMEKEGYVCGADESGRGPLAGDVYAAAVILPERYELPKLNDSKKLTAKQREKLYGLITGQAIAWAVGTASVDEIERLNILRAAQLAMNRAIAALDPAPVYALIDGNSVAYIDIPSEPIIGGDAEIPAIAAASIIAKVSRDRYMLTLDERYPQYGFARHKGYGTKLHYERLREFGVSPVHRMSFLKSLTGGHNSENSISAKSIGDFGEDIAAEYLISKGCTLLARNFRAEYGEIDIIAVETDYIIFAEVKTRRGTGYGRASEAVDGRKREKIRLAAQEWLLLHETELQPRFDIIEVYRGVSG
ncbi:MAG: ribonuclease HII, partial [Oscillospiraceae bacterium]|nr:ribonuclease HII [Oscillospiraceae bacterium]